MLGQIYPTLTLTRIKGKHPCNTTDSLPLGVYIFCKQFLLNCAETISNFRPRPKVSMMKYGLFTV